MICWRYFCFSLLSNGAMNGYLLSYIYILTVDTDCFQVSLKVKIFIHSDAYCIKHVYSWLNICKLWHWNFTIVLLNWYSSFVNIYQTLLIMKITLFCSSMIFWFNEWCECYCYNITCVIYSKCWIIDCGIVNLLVFRIKPLMHLVVQAIIMCICLDYNDV